MPRCFSYDAIVIGSGPNGLAAAIVLARAGHSVLVIEAAQQIGGGMRSASLTLPGFTHDVCSTVHALSMVSPFFSSLPLAEHGLEWVTPSVPLAHPLDNGRAVLLERSIEKTNHNLGLDSSSYHRLMGPFVNNTDALFKDILAPLHLPYHPWGMARFGLYGLRSSNHLARRFFHGIEAQALFLGLCAHANMPLEQPLSSAFGLVLGTAGHATGWPFVRGGSNYIGGDINGGIQDLRQLFFRPTMRFNPYSTPVKGLYICSSSTPPGGGVHGMCGFHAAWSVLKHGFKF